MKDASIFILLWIISENDPIFIMQNNRINIITKVS